MEFGKLKKFAQFARRRLIEEVSIKLKLVLTEQSAARRERVEAVEKLEEAIKNYGKEQLIERLAYIWFNRFCALRFMDVNRYTRIGVVSPADGQFQPEILTEAKLGHIDEDLVDYSVRQQVFDLLDGKVPSRDPQGEGYRLLVVSACNYWNRVMPFLFQRIDDYTELLMPDDLLSGNSILAYIREAMTPKACEKVEVIGWLYQYYISEKKSEVFEGLKKNKKITPENIPAATQLFTPHWIVRYLVENSLGRLWMLNRPSSKLIDQMDYYIKPGIPEEEFLRVDKPEELKICDPACGSGHMLSYAFDLLYAIYEEEGYESAEIPEKILTHNLYGIEIDERAGELAAFTLTMKARGKQRRFFNKDVRPNICVLENVHFDDGKLRLYKDYIGQDLFTIPLQSTLRQFEESDIFGSLIRPDLKDVDGILRILESKNVSEHLLLRKVHNQVLRVLRQADYLRRKYHVVIANPPYMGNRSMVGRLQAFAKEQYPDSKADLFSMFIERSFGLVVNRGSIAMITMQSWMFLSSFETLRSVILRSYTIASMAHLGARAFDTIGGEVVSTTAFVLDAVSRANFKGVYLRLVEGSSEREKDAALRASINNPDDNIWFDQASPNDFEKIPGRPIAYWAPKSVFLAFENGRFLGDLIYARIALATGDNARFIRSWSEVSIQNVGFGIQNNEHSISSGRKWFPCNKGGDYRKWYGNNENLVNWFNDGEEIKSLVDLETGRVRSHNYNGDFAFKESVTWSALSSSNLGVRYSKPGFMFVTPGSSAFKKSRDVNLLVVQALLSSKIADYFLRLISATINIEVGNILRIPVLQFDIHTEAFAENAVEIAKTDWDNYESSWDFTCLSLLSIEYRQSTLKSTYQEVRAYWQELTSELQRLEEANNRIFIDSYGLQEELMSDAPLTDITLTCNPHYRYGSDKSEEELESLLLADTMRDLVSYAVGCMFGRYALDKPGLVLANQGETIEDYLRMVPNSSFPADDDNVIPMLDGDWFPDDITERFREFLRVAFGEAHYEENIKFVEQALNIKGKRNYSIRDYFLNEFYNDHVKRYKKRPIYWLFSSPKGSFNALIYLHRYRPDTISVVLNDYLREFRTKLNSHKNHLEEVSRSGSVSQTEKTKALKEIEKVKKMIVEMEDYERDVLYPLATEQVEIDLDDGVKVNYPKFGAALKKIAGLEAKDE